MKWYLKLILNIFPSGRKLIKRYNLLVKLEENSHSINECTNHQEDIVNFDAKEVNTLLTEGEDYKVFFYK